MVQQQAHYNDDTPNNFPDDYDESKVDSRVKLRSKAIRGKSYGIDVRGALAQGLEIAGAIAGESLTTASDAKATSDNIGQRFDNQINGKVDPDEAIDFRHSDMLSKTFDTSRHRGDFFDNEFHSRGVSVKWFGAVGDGTTDDTDAVKATIEYCQDLNGETDGEHSYYHNMVYFPNGKYYLRGTGIEVSNVTLRGENKFSAIIISDQIEATFTMKMHSTITDLGFEDATTSNLDGTVTTKMIAIDNSNLGTTSAYFAIRLSNLFFRGQEGVIGASGKSESGIWTTDCIYLDLDGVGVWDLKIDDVTCNYVHSGLTINTKNDGWLTGSFFNNILVRGFSGWHTAIISDNQTARQVSQSVFSNLTAEVVYQTAVNAIGFIVSGVGNDWNNLMLFADGAYSGHAIQLKYYGPSTSDPKMPNFGYGSSANNLFSGGTVEGDIDDPDGIRELQSFKGLRLQVKNSFGGIQQVEVGDPIHTNLLADDTIARALNKSAMISLAKTATATDGTDQYGKYLEITTGADFSSWDILFTDPKQVLAAIKDGDHSVGVRFRKMTDTSEIDGGYLTLNGLPTLGTDIVGRYQNPNIHGDVSEYSWVYKNDPDYFAKITNDNFVMDRLVIKVAANSKVRLYGAYLVPGRAIDFSRVTQTNANNRQLDQGGRNYIQAGNTNWLQSTTPVTNQALTTQGYDIAVNDIQWLRGKPIVISTDMSVTSYVAKNVTSRYAAQLSLDITFEDGSVVSTATGAVNTDSTRIFGRYSMYLTLPDKVITKAHATLSLPSGFTASSYRLGNAQLESGTVAHDYISYTGSRDE